MHIVILGSGLIGITSAYKLAQLGFKVTVVERNLESGAETSYANGGQLSYSHSEPWANPEVLRKLAKYLFDTDSPLVLRPRADLEMIKWIMKFLHNCLPQRAMVNCINILRLNLYSREEMRKLRNDCNIDFDFSSNGILHIFSNQHDLDHAARQAEFQAKFGCKEILLSSSETLSMEPALANSPRKIIGGIFAPLDEMGDAYLFCKALAKYIQERFGVNFLYGTNIETLIPENNHSKKIAAIKTSQGEISADAFVVALGSYSPLLLAPLSIKLPIYPLKGYSITFPADELSPEMAITDASFKIVYSRIGKMLRIAGTAEFAGYNQNISNKRINSIMKVTNSLFPHLKLNDSISSWACLRSSTPDGLPIIGRTPYNNLFLNTGHGSLGWTQAAGSAALLADIMTNRTTSIITSGMIMERFL